MVCIIEEARSTTLPACLFQVFIMSTHFAVATVGIKAELELIEVPTVHPIGNQVRVRNEWTASTPLDLHQNDGGLLVKHPQVLGDGTAGTVVEVGPDVKRLKVGDKVFGFTWRSQAEKAHQEFVTAEEWLLAQVSDNHPRTHQQLTLCSSQMASHWRKP